MFRSNVPSFGELAREARDGDPDAALQLARKSPCKGFLSFLARWVPEGEMTTLAFDTLADGYRRMELERLDAQVRDIPEKVEKDKEAA